MVENSQEDMSSVCLHSWFEHKSSITDLAISSGGSSSVAISCSLDCTCKVWRLGNGTLQQTFTFPGEIKAITLDPGDRLLFAGSVDGTIFVNELDIGLQGTSDVATENQSSMLIGHRGSITALAFTTNQLWLVSAAEDCTARIWDVVTGHVIRIFNHRKGQITNILVIPQILFHAKGCQKNSSKGCLPGIPVSSLEKSSKPRTRLEETVAIIPSYCSLEEELAQSRSYSAASMKQQILDLEQEWSPEAIQMKVESSVENRMQATSMIKNLIEVNKNLQSKFLDMIQNRLCPKSDDVKSKMKSAFDST
ncbi:protein ROOT INITIATION DEFECTIVE 3 [Cryptomeria japonica]|uniref:protein ROOT INITIATION DEFECTIVE 3 n=1 Tax=Cryptomeria japonica TaxID=3369 RepID=UPI0027DA651D|nr:protein ROOT INITIATION DEFECTIVE 3 [Cryptomeria japonica]XP_059076313.1 protein ROOT INITIATION DEFECTIVE 3 [Cryptomeria japonica]XP_059076316.1 protein ROOT INITIATION DEFECTIVE 3 [Cryptomeria japonica]